MVVTWVFMKCGMSNLVKLATMGVLGGILGNYGKMGSPSRASLPGLPSPIDPYLQKIRLLSLPYSVWALS